MRIVKIKYDIEKMNNFELALNQIVTQAFWLNKNCHPSKYYGIFIESFVKLRFWVPRSSLLLNYSVWRFKFKKVRYEGRIEERNFFDSFLCFLDRNINWIYFIKERFKTIIPGKNLAFLFFAGYGLLIKFPNQNYYNGPKINRTIWTKKNVSNRRKFYSLLKHIKMKNIKMSFLSLCLVTFFCFNNLKSQSGCPYSITSNLQCPIIISYDFLDAATCASTCGGPFTVQILPSQTYNAINGCCSTPFYISLYVTDINNTPINASPNSPQVANVQDSCTPVNLSDGGSCSTACDIGNIGVWTITYGINGATIQ